MSATGTPGSFDATTTGGRAWEIVISYIRRRAAGEQIEPTDLIAAHPDIPELASELAKLDRIQGAIQNRRGFETGSDGTVARTTAPEPATTATQSGPGVFPGYCDCRELSRGGQGVVYRAVQEGTNRDVAIKVLLEGRDASASSLRRFEREIEIAAKLKHPNIVTVFHSGRTSLGVPYYVMDFVNGVPLTTFVRARDLTADRAIRLFCRVCEAVQHAHLRGIIHRDLKPSNILVDENGEPRILDFGLARLIESAPDANVTIGGSLLGTVPYMSPEQVQGRNDEIDARTDVYSLGVILYQFLTGSFPYAVIGPLLEVLNNIRSANPTDLRLNWSAESGVSAPHRRGRKGVCPIDRDIETIVQKALQKQPHRRYQSAGDLARDLTYYLIGNPIEARRDSAWYVFCKLARQNLVKVVVAGSVLAIIVSAAVVIAFFYHEKADVAEKLLASAKQSRDFDENNKGIADHIRFAWFIAEWNAGRDARARELLKSFEANAPEQRALAYLLDPADTDERLLLDLPKGMEAVGYFAIGERALRQGKSERALEAFRRSALAPPSIWLREAILARLAQLGHAHSDSSGSFVQSNGEVNP